MLKFLKRFYFTYLKKYTIKTVHVRGRLSQEEEAIFNKSKGTYLIDSENIKYDSNFKDKKIILEIGFGNGQHLVDLAKSGADVCGVELYQAGIVKVLKEIENKHIQNLKIFYEDARRTLDNLPDGFVETMYILFPDPWPKVRHHKRRMLNESFIRKSVSKLSANGDLYIATDWQNYAEEIEKHLMFLSQKKYLKYSKLLASPVVDKIKETTFAKRAVKEGREISVFRVTP